MRSLPARRRHTALRAWGTGAALGALLASASAVSAQFPELKREVVGAVAFACPPPATIPVVAEADERQARQLGTTARQALILGEVERARGLLERATALDPRSAELAYRYGRVLEEVGETDDAVRWYCAALAAGADGEDAADARDRIDRYAEAERPRIPEDALEAFETGVAAFAAGRMPEAAAAFARAVASHPAMAEAEFNRGVALEAGGAAAEAVEAYRGYLRLRPDAPDAIEVSERIGHLQVAPAVGPAPGSTLALGLLVPGGGQFRTGRPLGGAAVLALAGGAAAAAFLVSETDVRCLHAVEPGGSCPPDQVVGRTTRYPWRTVGIAGMAAVAVGGAVEAFLHARGMRDSGAAVEVGGGATLLLGPSVRSRGFGADVRVLRVSF